MPAGGGRPGARLVSLLALGPCLPSPAPSRRPSKISAEFSSFPNNAIAQRNPPRLPGSLHPQYCVRCQAHRHQTHRPQRSANTRGDGANCQRPIQAEQTYAWAEPCAAVGIPICSTSLRLCTSVVWCSLEAVGMRPSCVRRQCQYNGRDRTPNVLTCYLRATTGRDPRLADRPSDLTALRITTRTATRPSPSHPVHRRSASLHFTAL